MKITRFLALAVAFAPMAVMAGQFDELLGSALTAAAKNMSGGGQKQIEQSATVTAGKYDDETMQKAWSCLPQLRGEFEQIQLVPAENAIPLVFSKIAFTECHDISKEEGDALRHSLLGKYFKFTLLKISASEHRRFPSEMEESVLNGASFDEILNYYQQNRERLDDNYLLSVYFGSNEFNRTRSQRERDKSEAEYRERADAEEKTREEAKLIAEQERKNKAVIEQQKASALEADLRAGRVKPANMEQAMVAYSAENGISLASAPKIRPDGKLYALIGIIENAGSDPEFLAMLGSRDPRYYMVKIPKSLRAAYFDKAKIGDEFLLVGRYTGNTNYKTIVGQQKSAPVFEAVYFVMR